MGFSQHIFHIFFFLHIFWRFLLFGLHSTPPLSDDWRSYCTSVRVVIVVASLVSHVVMPTCNGPAINSSLTNALGAVGLTLRGHTSATFLLCCYRIAMSRSSLYHSFSWRDRDAFSVNYSTVNIWFGEFCFWWEMDIFDCPTSNGASYVIWSHYSA